MKKTLLLICVCIIAINLYGQDTLQQINRPGKLIGTLLDTSDQIIQFEAEFHSTKRKVGISFKQASHIDLSNGKRLLFNYSALGVPNTFRVGWRGNKVYMNDLQLNRRSYIDILKSHPATSKQYDRSKGQRFLANGLGFISGFIIGHGLVRLAINNKIRRPKLPIGAQLGIGAGVLAIALPVKSRSKRMQERAMDLYNETIYDQLDIEQLPAVISRKSKKVKTIK